MKLFVQNILLHLPLSIQYLFMVPGQTIQWQINAFCPISPIFFSDYFLDMAISCINKRQNPSLFANGQLLCHYATDIN